MKKIITFSFVAMLGVAAFTGCKKKDNNSNNTTTTTSNYSMKATVGGTSFNVTNAYATILSNNLSITGNSGTSSATATAPYLTLSISDYTNPGTYNMDTTLPISPVGATWAPDNTMGNWKLSHTGSVTITSVTTTEVVGTFSFTCTDGTAVTGGSFTAKRF